MELNWKKNTVLTLTIDGYTAEGAGVARIDGRVVFVPHTLRGEVWEVNLVKANKNFAFGRAVTCLEPSPLRREKDCQFQGRCGGCQFRHSEYSEELFAKHQVVENALTRLGGLSLEVPAVLGAENQDRYRNKVQFPVSGSDKWIKIGFYRLRSHDVLDVPDCLLQPSPAASMREIVKNWMLENKINPYDEVKGKGTIRHLFLRNNGKGQFLLCLVATREKLPKLDALVTSLTETLPNLVGIILNVNKKDTNVVLGSEFITLWGEDHLYEELFGLNFKLSVPSFFQVNLPQTEVLYHKVEEFAALTGTETVLDLYCGIGTISLILAKQAKNVIGAEIIQQAVADATENAQRNNISNAQFVQGDCGEVAEKLKADGIQPDVIIMDPPRKGLAPNVPEILATMGAQKIVYVSCDPATLARDLKKLTELGYTAVKVQPVDLFPRTRHVECVVLLTKNT